MNDVCESPGIWEPLAGLLRAVWQRRLLILTYHGFREVDEGGEFLPFLDNHIPVDTFRRQLVYLKAHYVPVRLKDALKALNENKGLPKRAVVVTMDDGYGSNCSCAFPLLKEYVVPATIFLTTSFLDREAPLWTDRLTFAVVKSPLRSLEFCVSGDNFSFDLSTLEARQKAVSVLNAFLRRIPQETRDQTLTEIERQAQARLSLNETCPPFYRPLRWEEVRTMRSSGLVDFGAHGHRHYILSRCSADMLREDIVVSRQRMTEEMVNPPALFAYPSGEADDLNESVRREVKNAGFLAAVTTGHGLNRLKTEAYMLRRISINSRMDIKTFALVMVLWPKIVARIKNLPRKVFKHACHYS